jgi:HTH-type transcriptional regulator / antitoxin HigA
MEKGTMKAQTNHKPCRKQEDQFMKLVQEFPLRPIRSKADYKGAGRMLDKLAVRDEKSLFPGEADYLETLCLLIEQYDEKHFRIARKRPTPIERLTYLMEQSGMTQAELGRLLGSSGLASQILRGKRQLSKAHIRKLADHFKVDPGLFL